MTCGFKEKLKINKMKKIGLLLFIGFFLLSSCTKDRPDRAFVVGQLKNAAKLSSTEFVVSKVLSAKKQKVFLGLNIGKEATFMSRTKAYIKAGVNLDKLGDKDIEIEGQKIVLNLPAVEITNFNYPAEEFETIDKYSDAGFWNHFSAAQKDEIYQFGETEIKKSLSKLDLIKETEKNTRLFLKNLLIQMGFNEIYIHFKENKNVVL